MEVKDIQHLLTRSILIINMLFHSMKTLNIIRINKNNKSTDYLPSYIGIVLCKVILISSIWSISKGNYFEFFFCSFISYILCLKVYIKISNKASRITAWLSYKIYKKENYELDKKEDLVEILTIMILGICIFSTSLNSDIGGIILGISFFTIGLGILIYYNYLQRN